MCFDPGEEYSQINWDSFQVCYLKLIRFDITKDLRPYLSEKKKLLYIPKDMVAKNFQKGKHRLLVSLKDRQGRVSELKIEVKVK